MSGSTDTWPLVSVILPAYKARNYLRESLTSVAAQDYPNLEVWVIDDKSPEPIDDILAEYRENQAAPPLELIRHEVNQGLGAARNTGIRAANGEFVAFLDHDDLWAPGHASSVMAAIREGRCDLGFCTVMLFQKIPGDADVPWGPPPGAIDAQLPYRLFQSNFITPSSVIAAKTLLDRLGGFSIDPSLHMCEDLDLWLRALAQGAKFAHSPHPTVHYRKHAEAATSRKGYMSYQAAKVREIHFLAVRGPFFRKCSKVASLWWEACRSLSASGGWRTGVLVRAILWSLPVPWEIARGLIHWVRLGNRRARHAAARQ